MAFTTTTLAAALSATDRQMSVTSATGFAANQYVKIDEEFFKITSSYTSGTIIPFIRAQNGTVAVAHVSGANVVTDAISSTTTSDWNGPNSSTIVAYGLSARRRKVIAYGASGAIALPLAGEDVVAILDGTSTLTMTLAAPLTDSDGAVLTVIGNGKSASTLAVSSTAGIGNAGSGYQTITFQNAGQVSMQFMACNGQWVALNTPITSTTTKISVAIS